MQKIIFYYWKNLKIPKGPSSCWEGCVFVLGCVGVCIMCHMSMRRKNANLYLVLWIDLNMSGVCVNINFTQSVGNVCMHAEIKQPTKTFNIDPHFFRKFLKTIFSSIGLPLIYHCLFEHQLIFTYFWLSSNSRFATSFWKWKIPSFLWLDNFFVKRLYTRMLSCWPLHQLRGFIVHHTYPPPPQTHTHIYTGVCLCGFR